jgi:hypothetical protein
MPALRWITVSLLSLLLATPSIATLRTECRRACDETIRQCVTAHGGRHRGTCTARVRRHHGLEICLPPPTTTRTTTHDVDYHDLKYDRGRSVSHDDLLHDAETDSTTTVTALCGTVAVRRDSHRVYM